MSGMQATSLGWAPAIPSSWKVVPLNFVAKMGTGHTPDRSKTEYWENCTIPWVTTPDVTRRADSLAPLMETEQQISELGMANSAAVLHPTNTVMLSRTASVGYSVRIGRPMATTQAFVTWHAGPDLDPRYLLLALRAMKQEWRKLAYGSTHLTIYMPDLESIRIPLPPLEEQRRIADFLDAETARIDCLNRATERQQKLVAERQSVAFHDSVQCEGGPDLNIIEPEITNHGWHMTPLNHALNQLTNGYVGPTRDLFVDDGVRYLQSLHIKNGRINFARRPYFVKREWADERPRIRLGFEDLLIVQTGAIGEVGLVDDEYVGASCHALLIARTNRSILAPRYLWHAFRSHWGRNALLREQTGALHPHLEAGNVRFMKVPVPALDTQRRVVARTEEIARDTVTIERALSRRLMLQSERREALITAAVTGQFDVSTASGRNVMDGVTA